jgi:hypothetical protein
MLGDIRSARYLVALAQFQRNRLGSLWMELS